MRKLLLLSLVTVPGLVSAQHDYRNLDHGRPIATEDAFPVERGAFEVMFPWSHEREGGENGLMFEPEFMLGLISNGMVGMGAPILLGDGGGLAGLRPFAFYTLFDAVGRSGPALAIRLDGTVPVGTLGGDEVSVSGTAIATASFGATRFHFNTSQLLGGTGGPPLEDTPPSRSWSVGLDYTFWRQSMVVMADVQRQKFECYQCDERAHWIAGLGVRMQATPTTVFDIGMQRRLSALGPDLVVTAGLTRSFSLIGDID